MLIPCKSQLFAPKLYQKLKIASEALIIAFFVKKRASEGIIMSIFVKKKTSEGIINSFFLIKKASEAIIRGYEPFGDNIGS
jgi:hypothetical protein